MTEMNAFIQLFSDEASMPDRSFINSLERRFVKKASGLASGRRIRISKKTIIIATIVTITATIAVLVFLPKRDMSDPVQDSIIETVIESTQDSVSTFTDSAPTDPTDSNATVPSNSVDSSVGSPSVGQTAAGSSVPVAQPVIVSGFMAEFWNLDVAEIAGTPTIPAGAPQYATTANAVLYSWGSGSPVASINSDYFVARFSKSSNELNGQYKVVYASDNGLRMHVNETVVFDQWNAAGTSGTAYFLTDPAEPVTTITIEYLEMDGPASVSVSITKL